MQLQVAPSQAQELQRRLREATRSVTAGAVALVDLRGLKIQKSGRERLLDVTNMRPVRVRCVRKQGNGAPVPAKMEFKGLRITRTGNLNIWNVLVDATGPVTLFEGYRENGHRDRRTEVEFVG